MDKKYKARVQNHEYTTENGSAALMENKNVCGHSLYMRVVGGPRKKNCRRLTQPTFPNSDHSAFTIQIAFDQLIQSTQISVGSTLEFIKLRRTGRMTPDSRI